MKNNSHFLSKVASGLRSMTTTVRTTMRAVMLLVAALMLMPQMVMGNEDFEEKYLFDKYNYGSSTAIITFRITYYDYRQTDEGFVTGDGLVVKARIKGTTEYTTLCKVRGRYDGDDYGYIVSQYYNNALGVTPTKVTEKTKGQKQEYVDIKWELPFQWRNTTIEFYSGGTWSNKDETNSLKYHDKYITKTVPYTFSVRDISWNGSYSVSSSGIVTVPYTFGGGCNTDGETHICTNINNSYNGNIGYKYPNANYNNSSYEFKLSTIGKSLRDSFTIQPYHEFTHDRDKDANNGVKNYVKKAGAIVFKPLPKATNFHGNFHQDEKKVYLTWKSDNSNYAGQGRWVIYRDNEKIADVAHSVTSYTDSTFTNDAYEKYKIYYVMEGKGWSITNQVSELCSDEITVDTHRSLLIHPFVKDSVCWKDRIVLTWTSDAYPVSLGHKFNIYWDEDSYPIYTLIPTAYQDSFRWEHRTDTVPYAERVSGMDGTTHYTQEPFTGSTPHTYRIVSMIGDTPMDTVYAYKKAIGMGARINQLEASKDAYAGQVKLSWYVNRLGSNMRQTYYVDRRKAGSTNDSDYRNLHMFSSTEDYLFYTDETPLPGVYYEYRVRVEEYPTNRDTLKNDASAIGFSQAYGTVSGRITYGATGTAVANVEVKAKLLENYNNREHHHSIRFTGENGKVRWNYPSNDYAQTTFANNNWTMQMWLNPDSIKQQRLIELKQEKQYFQRIIDIQNNSYLRCKKHCYTEPLYTYHSNDDLSAQQIEIEGDSHPGYICCEEIWGNQDYQSFQCAVFRKVEDCGYIQYHSDDWPSSYLTKNQQGNVESGTYFDACEYITQIDTTKTLDSLIASCYVGLNQNNQLVLHDADSVAQLEYVFEGLTIQPRQYSHLTLTRNGNTLTAYVTTMDEEGLPVVQSAQVTLTREWDLNNAKEFSIGGFKGYVDEFRLWTKALTEAEIMDNYDRMLVGDEANLEIYWTFDEGLRKHFFDYSRTGSVYHGHHGIMGSNTQSDTYVPGQLSLRVKTDVNGNYVIRGIPFAGEGTTYAIEPSLAPHQFNPTQQLRFVSSSSLVHNGTDFDDVSSFTVSGKVLYAGTSYPVTGCNLYVDGEICTKDGSNVETNSEGEFEISVPIGDHFIQIKKDGHVFAKGGRYPDTGTRTFTQEIHNLTFTDTTLVNFTGRVVGGDIEGNKPVGFGLSSNNIGVATLELTPNQYSYSTGYSLSTETDSVPVFSARDTIIQSKAWRRNNTIFIKADPRTGEFSALIPPLDYTLNRMYVESSDLELLENPMALNMTDPQTMGSDSVIVDSTLLYYTYHTLLRQVYHDSEPVFRVWQRGHEDGSFGMDKAEVEDGLGHKTTITDIHHINADTVEYTYGYPLFRMYDSYFFELQGYEEFVNRDYSTPRKYKVPLANCVVTIDNELSAEQPVYAMDNEDGMDAGQIYDLKSNQLLLDSAGKASYSWQAGLPNISGDYTRSLYIYYTLGDRRKGWNAGQPLTGIVLGAFPTGNGFVTGGPDQVNMILRDPPGSQSFATWETGTVTTRTEIYATHYSADSLILTGEQLTPEVSVSYSDADQAPVSIGGSASIGGDFQRGRGHTSEVVNSNTISTSVTATRAISTSDSSEYDGAEGDLFIGTATNHIFGDVKSLNLYKNPLDSTVSVGVKDNLGFSVSFGTEFAYSQHYIVHDLLPGLKAARNSLLTQVANKNNVDTTGMGNKVLYVTELPETDPNYGVDTTTYRMITPHVSGKVFEDSVLYFNQQIANWKAILSDNEKEKWDAFTNRNALETKGLAINHSFDAGSMVTITRTTEESNTTITETHRGWQHAWNYNFSFSIIGFGFKRYNEQHQYKDTIKTSENDTIRSTTFSYTLRDSDPDDAITVDVYSGQGQFGSPIFRTRGGKTSNPYEGEVRTQYYESDLHILMEATKQVEVPAISAVPTRLSDVPSGSAANFALHLDNNSYAGADCTFKLYVEEQTNPNGAQLLIDGTPLTGEGRLVKVRYGQTLVKSLQLRQSDLSVFNYDDIVIRLESQYQSDISAAVSISAQFVPSASPATLAISTNSMNIEYDSIHNSCVTLTMSDFDRTYHNQKEFRLQCKQQGDDWTDLHTFVLNKADSTSTRCSVLPPTGNTISYKLNMTTYVDGTYLFRIVSVSTFGYDEITRESNEVELVKNLARPCPLGQAQPTDGILDIGDEVSVTFNMPFLSGELNKNNFIVTGVLNGSPVEHHTALLTVSDTSAYAAKTMANINLSDKDFSLDAWLNIRSEGVLLSHGVDNRRMTVGTNAQGQLVLSFAGAVYVSTEVVPRNKWLFFTMSRQVINNKGKINVAIVDGANAPRYLFTDKEVALYNDNGPLSVGLGAEATVHELLLWDEARDMATAWQEHTVTKSPSTRHLIGYWKMDEGEGKTIRDHARNRNMVMSAETWYLNNENKAVALDGTQHIAAYTAPVALRPQDDFAVELWMQGGAQADTAQVFQLGDVSLYLDTHGALHLQNNDDDQKINGQNLNDGVWHHVMLNVRRIGTAAVYIDGQRALTISADRIGSVTSDPVSAALIVGARRASLVNGTDSTDAYYIYDRHFTGSVDEIRLWKTTIASDLLVSKRKIRLTGGEPGLSLYYPFEKTVLDEYQQPVTVGTLEELTGKGTPVAIAGGLFTDNAPALREKPTQSDVTFAFTASDTKIVIDVKEIPANIDGCTLNFTVQNVRSVNGNGSLPATWSAFIHRNELAWQDEDLTVVKREDESYTVTTSLINRSGTPQRWSLSDLPTSLTASSTSGMLNPLEREEITFVVDETAPIGKHERTIYAMGNNGVLTPITLHLTVTGDIPEWTVNPSAYPFSMDVIGQLDVFGKISENEDDMVAAFIGDECRGVAHPKYMERYDGYFVTLTISGNDIDNNKPITFRAYDASTGITYTQVAPDSITYHSLSIIGRYNAPELFSVKDLIEQNIQLMRGWNWISLYVTADTMSPRIILDGIKEDVELIKGQTGDEGFLIYSYGMWGGSMANLTNSKMYSVKMRNDRTLRVVGQRVNTNECPIELATGWNWIGYCSEKRMNIGTALADMDPQSEDLILSQRGMAYYDDYEWVGSLSELQPGCGYIVFNSGQTKQFTYPSQSVAAAPDRIMARTATIEPVVGTAYPYNMVLFARVTGDGKPLSEVQLLVYAGDECRAAGVTDENGRVNMLIPGEETTTLSFAVVMGDSTYNATETLNYETDAIVGTPEAPFLINLTDVTGLFGTQAETQKTGIYDVLGRRLPEDHYLPQGVYIINGKKVVR